jgi:hypothetical protein
MGRSASVARRVSGFYRQLFRLPFNLFIIFLYPFVGVDNGRHATEQETRHWGCQVGQHATDFMFVLKSPLGVGRPARAARKGPPWPAAYKRRPSERPTRQTKPRVEDFVKRRPSARCTR